MARLPGTGAARRRGRARGRARPAPRRIAAACSRARRSSPALAHLPWGALRAAASRVVDATSRVEGTALPRRRRACAQRRRGRSAATTCSRSTCERARQAPAARIRASRDAEVDARWLARRRASGSSSACPVLLVRHGAPWELDSARRAAARRSRAASVRRRAAARRARASRRCRPARAAHARRCGAGSRWVRALVAPELAARRAGLRDRRLERRRDRARC